MRTDCWWFVDALFRDDSKDPCKKTKGEVRKENDRHFGWGFLVGSGAVLALEAIGFFIYGGFAYWLK